MVVKKNLKSVDKNSLLCYNYKELRFLELPSFALFCPEFFFILYIEIAFTSNLSVPPTSLSVANPYYHYACVLSFQIIKYKFFDKKKRNANEIPIC